MTISVNKNSVIDLWWNYYFRVIELSNSKAKIRVKNRALVKWMTKEYSFKQDTKTTINLIGVEVKELDEYFTKKEKKCKVKSTEKKKPSGVIKKEYIHNNEYTGQVPVVNDIIVDVTSMNYEACTVRANINNIDFITHSLNTPPITKKKDIIKTFLLREKPFYYFHQKVLRKIEDKTEIIINILFNNLIKLPNKRYSFYDKINNIELQFWKDITLWEELIEIQKCEAKDWTLTRLINKIEWIKEREGREHVCTSSIGKYIANVNNDSVFQIKYKDKKNSLLAALDLDIFYLLNISMLEEVLVDNKKVKRKLFSFKPIKINLSWFTRYVDTFLEYMKEDYDYEYDDTKILDLSLVLDNRFEPYSKRALAINKKDFDIKLKKEELITSFFPKLLDN